jgi:preprotein translocase subunit SecE
MATPSRNGRWARTVRFLHEVRQELAKVIWPTTRELVTYTIVVMVAVLVLGSFIYALDYWFSRLVSRIFVDHP